MVRISIDIDDDGSPPRQAKVRSDQGGSSAEPSARPRLSEIEVDEVMSAGAAPTEDMASAPLGEPDDIEAEYGFESDGESAGAAPE